MAFSNEMEKLAARAKLAEERIAASGDKARADLEREVDTAREKQTEVRNSVRDYLAGVRERHDRARAERDADEAQLDALYAIDYAYGAIEEAESLVFDAELARMDADELEAGAPTTT